MKVKNQKTKGFLNNKGEDNKLYRKYEYSQLYRS